MRELSICKRRLQGFVAEMEISIGETDMKQERGSGRDIDLAHIFLAIRRKIGLILVISIVFGMVSLILSTFVFQPVYQASAKVLINTRNDANQNVTNDQLTSAKNLAETYAIIIRSRTVLEPVISQLGLQESYEELSQDITVESVNNTQILKINVRHNDPETAGAITTKILEIAPVIIDEKVEAGKMTTVEDAYVQLQPISPDIPMNVLLAILVGLVLGCLVFALPVILNNTYGTEEELQEDLGIPVLGAIPTLHSCNDGEHYGA